MRENVKLWVAISHIQAAKDCLDELKVSNYNIREFKQMTNNFNKQYKKHFENEISKLFDIDDEIFEGMISQVDSQINKIVLDNKQVIQ